MLNNFFFKHIHSPNNFKIYSMADDTMSEMYPGLDTVKRSCPDPGGFYYKLVTAFGFIGNLSDSTSGLRSYIKCAISQNISGVTS